jgi:hypothetical protein
MTIEAMKLALEALEMLARYENPETRIQVRKPKDGGPIVTMYPHKVATDAADDLRTAIAEAEKQEPHELLCVCGATWCIYADSGEELVNAPPAAQRQHVTDGSPCWCEPETSYTDPETGASVIVHKEPQ